MNGLDTAELGKVAPISASSTAPAEDDVWLLNLDMVESNTGVVLDYLYVPVDSIGTSTCRFDTGNVLYSKLRPYLNKVVLPDRDGYATSEMLPLRPDTNRLTREYLTYFLRSPQFVRYISAKVSGAKMPRANTDALRHAKIPLPSLDEQRRIALELDLICHAMDVKKEQLAQLDLLVKARFFEMFGDPVEDSKHWGHKPLREFLTSVKYGTSLSPTFSDAGFAFIRATNIKNGYIVDDDMKYIDPTDVQKFEKCRLNGGEVIIVRSGVNTGDTCVITNDYVGQYAGYDIILTLESTLDPIFLNTLINTPYMEKVVKPLTKRAAQPHINSEQVQSLPIICVPNQMQREFATFVGELDKSRELLKQLLDQIQLLYDERMNQHFGDFDT